MRWRLCKHFKVPVDDEIFKTINNAQYIWYQIQFALDEKEKFELLRDVAEHNAMFTNPEAVEQIRNSRENTYAMNDKDFNSMIKDTFGRELNLEDRNSNMNIEELMGNKVAPYLNMELDEIKFIPIGRK